MKRGPHELDTPGLLGLSLAVVALSGLLATSAVAQEKQEKEGKAQEHERQAFVVRTGSESGGYLGVRLREVNGEVVDRLHLPEERGALVVKVVDDTPAQQAGLKADDVIQTWNGTRVESAAQLSRLARETPAGRTVHLGVFRDGRQQQISVKLGERSDLRSFGIAPRAMRMRELMERAREGEGERGPHIRAFSFGSRGRLGVRIQSLSDQLAGYFGVKAGEGALITEVVEDSPAAKAGLKAGDVILSVAGGEVDDPRDVSKALRGREAGPVELRIMREHREQTVTVELEKGRGEGAFLSPAPIAPLEWRFRTPIEVEIITDGFPGADWEEWAEEWKRWGQEIADQAQEVSAEWTTDWEPRLRDYAHQWQDWARQFKDAWWNSSVTEALYD